MVCSWWSAWQSYTFTRFDFSYLIEDTPIKTKETIIYYYFDYYELTSCYALTCVLKTSRHIGNAPGVGTSDFCLLCTIQFVTDLHSPPPKYTHNQESETGNWQREPVWYGTVIGNQYLY